MISQQLPGTPGNGLAQTVNLRSSSFSTTQWLRYFQDNKKTRANINFANDDSIPIVTRAPLIRSLQRFQIGETGEGKHLRKYARLMDDPIYEECIDLFIKEEQYHAVVLSQIIQSMNGALLTWHWSDLAFIALRRMLGLKTELFILLIAEIIGKCFYSACANNLENSRFRDAFALIVLDEISHLEFHCEFLHYQMNTFPLLFKRACYLAWWVLFMTACQVFVADHRRALKALNVGARDFLHDCSKTFHRAALKIFAVGDKF